LLPALAAVPRLAAARGDFWFDEIWSWSMTLNLGSWWSILTRIRHDNNHYLNTWIVYLIGPDSHWIAYRIPAVLAGVASVWLAGRIARRGGVADAWTAMILTGGSYLLILYSSEARGYAYAVLFSLICFLVLDRALERGRLVWAVPFVASAILGFLSQLIFAYVFAALLVWAVWRAGTGTGRWPLVATAFAPPILFAGWLYVTNVQGLTVGGSTSQSVARLILASFSLASGGPEAGALAVVFASATTAIWIAGIRVFVRTGSDRWVFYLALTLILPVFLASLPHREYQHVRHLLLGVVFFLLLAAHLLAWLWRRGAAGRALYAVLLAGFLAGNVYQTARLLRVGRGSYRAALETILAESRTLPATIGSDHDFRNGMLFKYYKAKVSSPKDLYYHTMGNRPPLGPEWLILHDPQPGFRPEPSVVDGRGNRYRLAHVWPHAGLSGWTWAVYHNLRAEAPPPVPR
jgi:hypothetical protein